MANKEVKYAPKAVIDELDAWTGSATTVGDLLTDIEKMRNGFTELTREFIVGKDSDLRESIAFIPYELAVIEHKFGTERLHPEREPRYYAVVPYDSAKEKVYVRNSDGTLCDLIYISMTYSVDYEQGISRELAENIAKEFGGKAKVIK